MKKKDIYRGNYDMYNDDEFDHKYACWASNHNGWAKMKRANKRLAKHREKQKFEKDYRDNEIDYEELIDFES